MSPALVSYGHAGQSSMRVVAAILKLPAYPSPQGWPAPPRCILVIAGA